jgi:hypothetical protein
MTTTFCTPSRRESLKDACSHSPTPGKIEHDRAAVEPEPLSGRPVEHATQVALAQPLEGQSDGTYPLAEVAPIGHEPLRHRRRRLEQQGDERRKRRL